LLLSFLRTLSYSVGVDGSNGLSRRPEMVAASRGSDTAQLMDGEADLGTATMEAALFWTRVYGEIFALEEEVMARIGSEGFRTLAANYRAKIA